MFKNFFFFLFLLVASSCATKDDSNNIKDIYTADATTALMIDGMMCQKGCADFINDTIMSIDGVVSSEVDFQKSTATIQYDNSVTSELVMIDLINSLKDSSYFVSNVDVELIK